MQYFELHCKTNFSFLEGASHAEELVRQAAELGYGGLAVTDVNSLAGVVRAHGAAKDVGLPLVIGAELRPVRGPRLVLWASDRAGYGRLARLLTLGRRRAPKGECLLDEREIAEHQAGLLAGVLPDRGPLLPDAVGADRVRVEQLPGSEVPAPGKDGLGLAEDRLGLAEDGLGLAEDGLGLAEDGLGLAEDGLGLAEDGVGLAETACPDEWLRGWLGFYRQVFGDRCYLLAELHRGADDQARLARLRWWARRASVPLAAAGDVHYHVPRRQLLHDVLTAIRHGVTVSQARPELFPNGQRHLRSLEELGRLYAEAPEVLRRTREVAERCRFSLDELRYEYPEELVPEGMSPSEYLATLAWKGAHRRYPQGIPDKVRKLLLHELTLIGELRYEAYFLTVWDLVRFARKQGILCQGRGSAANSAVCYCLGVTSVDPQRADLLFERFISRERNEAPDIDVDFEHERREEVLQYLYRKYGRERAGLAATVITYRARSAIRDVGKALGLSLDRVDRLAKNVDGHARGVDLTRLCPQAGLDPQSELGRRFVYLVGELVGFPRHLSQHVGGMVMTRGPLCELVPIENAAMPDRTVIQWDKDDLEELGILKVDCLALGMLTAIHRCLDLVRKQDGREWTLASIPEGDAAVYDMICRADTVGVFQIESRAQMSMLPRLKPRCYYDLVIEVAIVRPGPIQGQMVHPYLRRRAGEERVTYPSEAIQQVLEKTLGVPIFQEQAMRLAVVAAGFTPGEADQLRRAMGAWRRPGVIDQFRRKLLAGMRERGLPEQFAEQVFQQIRGFGEYGFPESHAASFALLVYVSAWLKHYYPAAFAAALINSQPMGFYAPAQLISDARDHGVPIRPLDVNHSGWDCTLERATGEELARTRPVVPTGAFSGEAVSREDFSREDFSREDFSREDFSREAASPQDAGRGNAGLNNTGRGNSSSENAGREAATRWALRLGLRLVAGLPREAVRQIEQARREGPFSSQHEFARRTGLGRGVLLRLAEADAFGSLDQDRRRALWMALGEQPQRRDQPLLEGLADEEEPCWELPSLTPQEEVLADYRTSGLSLRGHPVGFYRSQLDQLRVAPARRLKRLPVNRQVRVAGIVLLRQRPSTAKGITFVTLEDETGTANLVVRQKIWERYQQIARHSTAWIAHGKLERTEAVIHVVVNRLEDLSSRLGEMPNRSRDFR